MYLQKYATGSCVLVLTTGDGNYAAFLAPDVSNGILVSNDLDGRGYSVQLEMTNTATGSVTATLPALGTVGKTVSLVYPDTSTDGGPANGIWKGSGISFYCQKYQTGSCLLVVTTGNGTYTVFLDESYSNGISVQNDLDNQGQTLLLELTDTTHGTLTVSLPGQDMVTTSVQLTFADTP